MGARTQLAGLLAAIAMVLLFLTEPMQYLPKATLGAVIVAAAIGLVDPAAWRGLARTSRVEVAIAAVTTPGVLVYRLDDRLFFANARLRQGPDPRSPSRRPEPGAVAGVRHRALSHVDATGVAALTSLVESLGEDQITFVFARLKDPMRRALGEAGVLDLVGEGHVHPTVRAAVAAAASPVDDD
jgi:MFS superfamily sulfate permease-like transporter